MPFIDWNGNGKIDPTDIAVSLATDSESEGGEEFDLEDNPKHRMGCLTTVVSIVGMIVFAAFMLINRL